jgi:hypothetical protein
MKRRRVKQEVSFGERLALHAQQARQQAQMLPAGSERDALLKKARQVDTAAHINEWVNSKGLRPPE